MAAPVTGSRVALGLGAVGKQGLEAAKRSKGVEFFREVARCVPWTVHSYHLEELTTVPELRANIAALFRKYADVKTPEVIDLLIYKGRGELESVLLQHKQRHHLITKYVREPSLLRQQQLTQQGQPEASKFLESFYNSN